MRGGIAAGCILTAAAIALCSCAATAPPKQFRTFFVPPAPPGKPLAKPVLIDPPNVTLAWYANETPNLSPALQVIARPSDVDFLIKKADDRFAAGKRAFQEGRIEEGRMQFDRVLEVLLTTPENVPDR